MPDAGVELRLTNTGTEAWPQGMRLVVGWEASDLPYLPAAPEALTPLDADVPSLGPGESVVVAVELPEPPAGRALAWIGLSAEAFDLTDLGSASLQLRSEAD